MKLRRHAIGSDRNLRGTRGRSCLNSNWPSSIVYTTGSFFSKLLKIVQFFLDNSDCLKIFTVFQRKVCLKPIVWILLAYVICLSKTVLNSVSQYARISREILFVKIRSFLVNGTKPYLYNIVVNSKLSSDLNCLFLGNKRMSCGCWHYGNCPRSHWSNCSYRYNLLLQFIFYCYVYIILE